jgi:hypothetical protein
VGSNPGYLRLFCFCFVLVVAALRSADPPKSPTDCLQISQFQNSEWEQSTVPNPKKKKKVYPC